MTLSMIIFFKIMAKMKRSIASILVVLMSVLCVWSYADASGKDDHDNTIHKTRDKILSYFQQSGGEVSGISNDIVEIMIENDVRVKKGMRYSVFRKGDPFYHPVTNELLGHAENFIGKIEVAEGIQSDGSHLASIISGDVETGDKLRISSSKIKLAFFQDRKSDWAISEIFFDSLKNAGRFEVLELYTSSYEPDTLSKIARENGAEVVLMFSTPMHGKKRFLNVRLYWAQDVEMFLEIEEIVSQNVVMFQPGEELISAPLAHMEPWGSYKIQDGRLVAIGDVDNNGANEIVISDGNNIRIYGLKEELQELWFIKGKAGENHLSLDIIDLNSNGTPEIFVTVLTGVDVISDKINDSKSISTQGSGRLSSYVIEYDTSGGYRKIKEGMPYFFRVSDNTLLLQKFVSGKIFSGPVYEGEWKDGNYQPAKLLKLPSGVNIYGFTFVDWQNTGKIQLITYDDDGYLYLYDKNGEFLWKSKDSYGKFELSFAKKTYSIVHTDAKWSVRGRLVAVRTARGQEVFVVNKVPFVSRLPGLGAAGAEVYSLWWDGGMMDEKMVLDEVSGSVTDYWLEGGNLFLVARGNMMSFVKNMASGELTKGSMLYYYNFGGK